jgi:hypothetical protein
MTALWASTANAGCSFLVQATMDPSLVANYGAPATLWTNVTVRADGTVDFEVQMFNKVS